MRVFFALWPNDAVRAAVSGTAAALLAGRAGRQVPAHAYHLTLCFVGAVADAGIPRLAAAGEGIACPPVTLVLDRAGYFRRASACWLGPSDPPPDLAAFRAALYARVTAAGFAADTRAFHPHLTIARPCREPPPGHPDPPVHWPVDGFVLCASRHGGRYEVLTRYGHGTDEL